MLENYRKHVENRAAQGIVPQPLNEQQTADLVELLKNPPAGEEETLVDLANKVAEKVIKTNRAFKLNSMPPAERKIIHSVLNEYDKLETYSEGRDPNRYIVVKIKKEELNK